MTYIMTIKLYGLDEGTNCPVSELLAGNVYTADGTQLNFSLRPNTTNCYIAPVPYNDGTGRFRDYWFDHLNPNSVSEQLHVTPR
jgi:hypothetical protein